MNTEQLKVDLWQNACLNFCMLFCKILKDKPQGFNNELGLFQDRLNKLKNELKQCQQQQKENQESDNLRL